MNVKRTVHAANLLPDGTVLITGSLWCSNIAEKYDYLSGSFSTTGNMNVGRGGHSATLLYDDRVLIAGGHTAIGPVVTNSAEIYDPVTETFAVTTNMITGRQQHTDTLLDDGSVLVTGGYNGTINVNLAELFNAVISVEIDIKPGSYPNCMNINGNGVIPVAILGSDTFDVNDIDLNQPLVFSGLSVRTKGNGLLQCSFDDVSGDFTTAEGEPDGFLDLVCQFMDDTDFWNPDNGTATLSGRLTNGRLFKGTDSICLRPE
jgi:hypothetical protein